MQITQLYGQTIIDEEYQVIASGRGNRTPNQFAEDDIIESDPNFMQPFLPNANRGSLISYGGLENGLYEVTGQFFTKERQPGKDSFGYWSEDEYHQLLTSSDTTFIPGFGGLAQVNLEIPVYDGNLNLMVWDTDNNARTSLFKVDDIQLIESYQAPPPQEMFVNDYLGNWWVTEAADVLSTEDSVDSESLARWFNVQDVMLYGSQGTGVLGGTEPGYQTFNIDIYQYDTNDQLLFWDGENFHSLLPYDYQSGQDYNDEFFVETVSDEWGFLLMQTYPEIGEYSYTDVGISNVQWLDNYDGQLTQLHTPQYEFGSRVDPGYDW